MYSVIEGEHQDPNDIQSLKEETKKEHGPFESEDQANEFCKGLIQKNIDDFYHLAWVVKK